MTACVYIDFAEDGSILYVGATTNYGMRIQQHCNESLWLFHTAHTGFVELRTKTEAHALERTLIAAHNPPNNWLGRSVPNPRKRPTREENLAAVNEFRGSPEFKDCVLARRMRASMQVVADCIEAAPSAVPA